MFIPLFTVLAMSAQPAPAPSAAPRPLKVIGRVRATPKCANIVIHANAAIDSALQNDQLLVLTIKRLRSMDFESNPIARERSMRELGTYAGDLRADFTRGESEVRRLRELANASTDPTEKAHLLTFANALGGALYRQKVAVLDMNGFLAYIDAKAMASNPNIVESRVPTTVGMPATVSSNGLAVFDQSIHPNQMAQSMADDFEGRLPEIARDESLAAQHSDGALANC